MPYIPYIDHAFRKQTEMFGHVLRLPVTSSSTVNEAILSSKNTPRATLPVSQNRELLEHKQIKFHHFKIFDGFITRRMIDLDVIAGAKERYDEM